MIRVLDFVTGGVMVASLAGILSVTSPAVPTAEVGPATPYTTGIADSTIPGDGLQARPPGAFRAFPVGRPQTVRFSVDDSAVASLTDRARDDQRRDWLLLTVLNASGLGPEEIRQRIIDLPVARYPFMRQATGLEYGTSRSTMAWGSTVVALVPASQSPGARMDALGAIADRHRKDLGQRPDTVEVFEYSLMPDGDSAVVIRAPAVAGEVLFGAAAGYHEAAVSSEAQLEEFLHTIDDLTYGRLDAGTLVLGGRKLQGSRYRGIGLEEVAAVWGSQGEMENSGFSLDLAFDCDSLEAFFDLEAFPRALEHGVVGDTMEVVRAFRDAHDCKDAFLLWLGSIGNWELAQQLAVDSWDAGYQMARYDGELRGTEVGMVLFYTDLLAKIWSFDFANSTPTTAIPGFSSRIEIPVSPVFKAAEDSLRNGRLWFAPDDESYQLVDDGSLLFAPNATRIFAKSSDPLTPRDETQASPEFQAFIDWWDDHYEEIARYEPEYQRLNQIMKWSLMFGWLRAHEGTSAVEFLGQVPVDTSHWFPDWVRRHPELRFSRWDGVQFYGRGVTGAPAEAMAVLHSRDYSRFGKDWTLSGGVSLGNRLSFASRPALSRSIPMELRRGGAAFNGYASELTTAEGRMFRLASSERGEPILSSVARGTDRFISREGQLAAKDVNHVVRSAGRELEVGASVGQHELAVLRVQRDGGSIVARFSGRDMADAQRIALRLSREPDPARFLRADRNVAEAHDLGSRGQLARLDGSDQWVLFDRRRSSVDLPDGVDGVQAAANGRPTGFRFLSGDEARTELASGRATSIKRAADAVPGQPLEPLAPRDAARRAASDPAAFRARSEADLRARLRHADRAMERRDYDRVDELLSVLDDVGRQRPEVAVRRAIAELRRGRLESAAADLRGLPRLSDRESKALADHVMAAIGASNRRDRDALEGILDLIEFNSRGGGRDGLMSLERAGDRLVTKVAFNRMNVREAGGSAADEILAGHADLYAGPGLNNHDWSSAARQRTLHELVSGGRGRLKLVDEDLRGMDFDAIYAASEPQKQFSRVTARNPRVRFTSPPDRCDDQEGGRPRGDRECRRAYVLVTP